MLFRFKRFLSPPVFPDDPDKTAVAKILNAISLFISSILIIITPILVIDSSEIAPNLLWSIGTILGMLWVKILITRGHTYRASWLILIVLWLIGLFTFLTAGGVQAPGYTVLVIIVMLAGVLLGWRIALGVALLNSALGLCYLWMANQGTLPYSSLPDNDFRVWLFHSVSAVVIVMLLREGVGSIREALARAQHELHQRRLSEARFVKIFEVSPNAQVISELESGIILNVNGRFESLLGFSKETMQGKTAVSLNIYGEKGGRWVWADTLREQGTVRDLEISLRCKDGELLTCLLSAEAIELEGTPCAITFVQDITERKQADLNLLKSEARFRSIFEDAAIGMVLVGLDHAIVKTNYAFADMLGFTEHELMGSFFKDITFEEDVEISLKHHDSLMKKEIANYQFEKRYVHKQGHNVWAQLNVSFVDSADGQPLFAIAQIQNIHDRKQAEVDREMLIEELERRNAELERFSYTVSHDLKSPLVTIGGFLGFLERDVASGDTEQLQADINAIRKAAKKMRELLDELLELSRIGRLMNPPEPTSFAEIVQDALAITQGQLDGCEVDAVSTKFPIVIGDRVRLVEVVQNLVDNAAKFMGDQTHSRITIGVRQDDVVPVFFVEDNGIGIPPQHHEKIFDIFNKLDPDVEGTGIGLSLVKRIVEVHNGRLWVESAGLGKGSTFCFTLNEAEPLRAQP